MKCTKTRIQQHLTGHSNSKSIYLACSLFSVTCNLLFDSLPEKRSNTKYEQKSFSIRSLTQLIFQCMQYFAIRSSIFSLLRCSASCFISSSCSFCRICCSSWPCFLLCFSRSTSSCRSLSLLSSCFVLISSSSLRINRNHQISTHQFNSTDHQFNSYFNSDLVPFHATNLLICSFFSSSVIGPFSSPSSNISSAAGFYIP